MNKETNGENTYDNTSSIKWAIRRDWYSLCIVGSPIR